MMLKVLFYSYYTGVTSSRIIADKLDTDTVYMSSSRTCSPLISGRCAGSDPCTWRAWNKG